MARDLWVRDLWSGLSGAIWGYLGRSAKPKQAKMKVDLMQSILKRSLGEEVSDFWTIF